MSRPDSLVPVKRTNNRARSPSTGADQSPIATVSGEVALSQSTELRGGTDPLPVESVGPAGFAMPVAKATRISAVILFVTREVCIGLLLERCQRTAGIYSW